MWYNRVQERIVTMVLAQVRRTIEEHDLLVPGETVVVGVSGGPDSLCLLHCLCQLRADFDLALHVAHLHHGLRGEEADADADFVRALAADWGLPVPWNGRMCLPWPGGTGWPSKRRPGGRATHS